MPQAHHDSFIIEQYPRAKLEQIAPAINKLIAQADSGNIFNSPTWFQHWFDYENEAVEDFFLAVFDANKQLIAFAPWVIRKQKMGAIFSASCIEFIGQGEASADYLDVVCLSQYKEKILEQLANYLLEKQEQWDFLRLNHFASQSKTPLMLQHYFQQQKYQVQLSPGETCLFLPLDGNWESYLQSKSKNFRQKTRAKVRKFIEKSPGQYVQCETEQQIEQALTHLFSLNAARWKAQGQQSSFDQADFQQFHINLAKDLQQNKQLDLAYLELDGKIVAIIYNFVFKNKVYFYNTAFDPDYSKLSVGHVVMSLNIQAAFEAKHEEYDYLRGDYAYKREWSEDNRCNQNLLIHSSSLKLQILVRLESLFKELKSLLKRYLPKTIKEQINRLR